MNKSFNAIEKVKSHRDGKSHRNVKSSRGGPAPGPIEMAKLKHKELIE